jgi:hypothetical protein
MTRLTLGGTVSDTGVLCQRHPDLRTGCKAHPKWLDINVTHSAEELYNPSLFLVSRIGTLSVRRLRCATLDVRLAYGNNAVQIRR